MKYPRAGRSSAVLRWIVGLGIAAVVSATFGIATYFARRVLTPSAKPEAEVEVISVEDDAESPTKQRVWLRGPDVELDGSYSYIFDAHSRVTQHLAGHARLGPVMVTEHTRRGDRVARQVLSVERGELREGARGRITGWWFTEPEQLGHDVKLVSLPLPDGVGWGWVITPKNRIPGRWAVHVHGRGSLPHETLRGVGPFAEAGITSLVITYRNDVGAPAAQFQRYGLGLAEQLDVDASVGWVRSQGATHVTLVGWSMGGTACVLMQANGRNADLVDSMVLESPAIDWTGLLRRHARLSRVPSFIADLGIALLQLGIVKGSTFGVKGTDMRAITAQRLIASIGVPTLIHASPGDTFVPWQGSVQAAQQKPQLVRLHEGTGEHVKLWNANPEAWESETREFIRDVEVSRVTTRS